MTDEAVGYSEIFLTVFCVCSIGEQCRTPEDKSW